MFEISGEFGGRTVKISGGYAQFEEIEEALEKIEEIDKKHRTVSQIFDASRIAGKKHLLHSSKLALESLESGESFAENPRIELICWTAGLRQINKSLDRMGLTENSNTIAAVTIGKEKQKVKKAQKEIFRELDIEEEAEVLEVSEEKREDLKKAFSISENQLEVSSIEDIILEQVALLSLEQ